MIKGLPEKLKALREKYHFSQKQVAQKLRVSPSIVSSYETGERTPSTENLLALSYLFNCSTDFLLGKQQAKPEAVLKVDGLSDEQIVALSRLIDSIKQ